MYMFSHIIQHKIVLIEENIVTQFRNIFTQSGTIVVDGIAASSYTGKNNMDALMQHYVLKLFWHFIQFFDKSLIYDEYKMFALRSFMYKYLVKPCINGYTYLSHENNLLYIITILIVCGVPVLKFGQQKKWYIY